MGRTVVFVCAHSAARSRLAAAWFNADPPPGWHAVTAAGEDPATSVHPHVGPLLAGTPAALGHDRRAERALTVAGNRDVHRTDLGQQRLGPRAITGIATVMPHRIVLVIAQVLVHLRLESGLQEPAVNCCNTPPRPSCCTPCERARAANRATNAGSNACAIASAAAACCSSTGPGCTGTTGSSSTTAPAVLQLGAR
jgi:hypothetical protein